MKRFMIFAAGLTILFGAWAVAAEQAAKPAPAKAAANKTATVKMTKMRAPGTILEITDTTLIIERTVKNKVERMAFILEKPMKFKVGDEVRVSYIEADGRMVVTRIVKIADLKTKMPAKPGKDSKSAPGAAPAAK